MTTLRAIFPAFAPESLERSPPLPPSHRKAISAIPHCQSGDSGHRLYQCQRWGEQHRVPHSCGHRPCPPCQQHTTRQWFHHHLEQQRPGPYVLRPCTVPAPLRPFLRSQHRLAYHAMGTASAPALKRRATDERVIGTALPGLPGVLPPWGRQLQYPPHIHYIVPGGGLSKDRDAWLPSRANFFVPVTALSPRDRALGKEEMTQAGLLEALAPQGWPIPWNVHSQAPPHGPSALTSLAPSVVKVALSPPRLVSLTDRTVPFTSRKPGSARLRTTPLDAMAFLRRFLHQVLPEGFMQVRHFGCMQASCPIPHDTLRLLLVQAQLLAFQPPRLEPPAPCVACCPPWGGPMQVVRRLWTAHSTFVETG